jgi:hypothetical protein
LIEALIDHVLPYLVTRPTDRLEAQQQSTLRGYAHVHFASGIEIADMAVHVAGSRGWASPPARPWIEGRAVVIDPETSKARLQRLISFANHGVRARSSDVVLRALREAHPEAPGAVAEDAP